ncbi:T6SS phospholipase effector Tle1-like catalytic domain-containing protein [Pseudoduganella sp. HUAS MS19]
MAANIESAKNPTLFNSRSRSRPLNKLEIMQRAKAISAHKLQNTTMRCSGQVFGGVFFDGTGNNEEKDYFEAKGISRKQKQSNVVRLLHTYPQKNDETNKYYRTYIPGVGTPFPSIKDDGGAFGTAMSWNGEPRIVWGMFEVLNFVSLYVSNELLLSKHEAGDLSNDLGGVGSRAKRRNAKFQEWINKLELKIKNRGPRMPMPEQINLSVFGFSRGAAESRAFVNWLFDICEKREGIHFLAGVPLHINFLGIFDTVASVGIANAYSSGLLSADGHQSWADENMQIHGSVQNCFHIVAAHEVRSTFPVDSVRIEGRYPPNTTEHVYPGAHSDVGGGYSTNAQGKTDALARVAGFEMYCAALAAGVPLKRVDELAFEARSALLPSQDAINIFTTYMKGANIKEAPVEDMLRQHMAHYFTYRYQARKSRNLYSNADHYYSRKFFKVAPDEQEFLRDTQQHFIAILARAVKMMEKVQSGKSWSDHPFPQPFRSIYRSSHPDPEIPLPIMGTQKVAYRSGALIDKKDDGSNDAAVKQIREKVESWHKWLADNNYAYLVDEDAPERDIISVLQTLSEDPQPKEMIAFFDHWVHDSMAGLAKDHLNEFLVNGIGLAKFRRVYFGDMEDSIVRNAVKEANAKKLSLAQERRRQKRQWDLEAAEFARTRS